MSRESVSRVAVAIQTGLTPVAWGTTYYVATEFLPPGRPLLAATLRALPVGIVFVATGRVLPSGAWWWRALVLGTLNIGAFFALLFVAAFRLPGGVAATLGAVQPLVAAGLATALLGEKFRATTAAAAGLGIIGVALLVLRPGANMDALGIAAAFCATVSMATGIVLAKRWGRPVSLLAFTGWQLTVGGLLLTPLVFALEGLPNAMTSRNLGGFLWLCIVGTGAAYANWFRGIQLLPVTTTSALGLLSPVVATAIGWAALQQSLSLVQLVGAAVVLATVTLHITIETHQSDTPIQRNASDANQANQTSQASQNR